MNENTTNVEGLVFAVKDASSAVADKIGHSFERVHHAAEMAKAKVGEFAHTAAMGALASVGLGYGLHALFEKATDANMEMARVTKSVAGAQYAFQGWKPGLSSLDKMNYSMEQGAVNAEKLHQIGLKLRAPIEDMASTYEQVAAVGFGRLGMSQKGVLDLTEKITAAAKVYGISGSEAIGTINRALVTGQIRGVTPFAIAMKDALDLEHHTKKGQKLGPDAMMDRMNKSLGDMVPAARKMGDNMAGSLTEAKMLVDEMVRDLSGPLFREQTKNLSEWVQKLRSVREDGKSIMQIYGEKIASAFRSIKWTTGFIVDHWKSLLTMYAASKFAGAMSGFGGGRAGAGGIVGAAVSAVGGGMAGVMNVTAGTVNVGQGLTGLGPKIGSGMDKVLKPGMTSVVDKLTAVASKAGFVVEALTGLYVGLDAVADLVDKWQDRELAKQRGAAGLLTAVHNFEKSAYGLKVAGGGPAELSAARETAKASMTSALSALGLKAGEQVGASQIADSLQGLPRETATAIVNELHAVMPQMVHKVTGDEIGTIPIEVGREIANAMNQYSSRLFDAAPFDPNMKKSPRGHGAINIQNVNITQDFKEAQPNQVFHRVVNDIQDMVNAPGKARTGASFSGGTG